MTNILLHHTIAYVKPYFNKKVKKMKTNRLNHRMSILIDDKLKVVLDKYMEKEERDLSSAIRILIKSELKKQGYKI